MKQEFRGEELDKKRRRGRTGKGVIKRKTMRT
jgi:hypothetical protein